MPGKTFRLTLAALHSAPAWLAGKEFDRNFLRAFFLPDHIFEHSLYRCLLQQQLNTILEFQAEDVVKDRHVLKYKNLGRGGAITTLTMP